MLTYLCLRASRTDMSIAASRIGRPQLNRRAVKEMLAGSPKSTDGVVGLLLLLPFFDRITRHEGQTRTFRWPPCLLPSKSAPWVLFVFAMRCVRLIPSASVAGIRGTSCKTTTRAALPVEHAAMSFKAW